MMRNLKVLGLALVAAFAMSAVAASTASATNGVWTPGPGTVLGHDNPNGNTQLEGAFNVKCEEATYDDIGATGSTLLLTPTFAKCGTSLGLTATVTHEGCNYHVVLGTKDSAHTAPIIANLQCPTGKQITVHIYYDKAHTEVFCTLEIGPQGPLAGLTAHNPTNGHTQITGAVNVATNAVGDCTEGPTVPSQAKLNVDMTVTNLTFH